MLDSAWLTRKYTGQFAFTSHGFTGCTAVLDFFPMLLFHSCHGSVFNVELVGNEFKNFDWASFDAFAAAVALVSFNDYEVVA
jgi:hypothetical protein